MNPQTHEPSNSQTFECFPTLLSNLPLELTNPPMLSNPRTPPNTLKDPQTIELSNYRTIKPLNPRTIDPANRRTVEPSNLEPSNSRTIDSYNFSHDKTDLKTSFIYSRSGESSFQRIWLLVADSSSSCRLSFLLQIRLPLIDSASCRFVFLLQTRLPLVDSASSCRFVFLL